MNAELNNILGKLKQLLPMLSDRYNVQELGVFGSYVRQEHDFDSDLDILVTFSEPPSLLKFIEMENYLSDVLGVKVDLVMKDALKPAIGQQILKEVMQV
jgi:predicted nucleotidyltransferase